MKNKFKNYGLWVSVFAFVPILAQSLGTYNLNLIIPDNYTDLVNSFLGILVLAGVISNPSIGNGFTDKGDK